MTAVCNLIPEPEKLPKFTAEMPVTTLAAYLEPITPTPLPAGLPTVMAFDDNLLPEALRGYVQDAAYRTQCPPDFMAVALVVGISSVIGRKRTINPKQKDDWEVVPNQWGVLIGRPSAMKTPAINQTLRPIVALEARERERQNKALTEHKAAGEMLEMERKSSKAKAKKLVDDGDRAGALTELAKYSDDLPPPTPRRYIVNDASVEKLGELLNENPNGLLLVRDELGGWLSQMQTEDGAVARAFYLECFDGSGSFTYDRIGRGTVFIESCCMSMIGGIQPSRIAPLVRGAITGELDDGLVQRLQLAVWPDEHREWTFVDRLPNKSAKDRMEAVIQKLDQLPHEPREALKFTAAGQELFNAWYTRHMQEIRQSEIHQALQSHFMKMPQTIAGLALLFELVEGGRATVGIEAVSRALDWASYLKSHAGRVYGAAIHAPLVGARLIHERRNKLPEPFTPREVRSKNWTGLDSTESVNESLAVLLEHNLVISYEVAGKDGGRPSKRYVWRRGA
ncbi:YfjI family protein [Pseudomonas protegens]|uniref:YfjI family protein n=1 Tax=Pseudomonas protegens TaxID=380021 RepID=UPI00380340DB